MRSSTNGVRGMGMRAQAQSTCWPGPWSNTGPESIAGSIWGEPTPEMSGSTGSKVESVDGQISCPTLFSQEPELILVARYYPAATVSSLIYGGDYQRRFAALSSDSRISICLSPYSIGFLSRDCGWAQ